MSQTVGLRWQPSALALALATGAAAALSVAVLAGLAELVAFAAAPLGALAGVASRPGRPRHIELEMSPEVARCFEGEAVRMRGRAHDAENRLEATLTPDATEGLAIEWTSVAPDGVEWSLRTGTWGSYRAHVRITAHTAGGLLRATADVAAAPVRVYPGAERLSAHPYSARLPDRIGAHIARQRGQGVEFAGIRPYTPGDRIRDVNWPVSARRGKLHVTERLAERAADIVALIDTLHEPGRSRGSLDTAVHGAAQLVQAALRGGDRAGVVALGGRVRWLGPDIGQRQFYRVVDAVLDADPAVETARAGHFRTGQSRIPPTALPPSALVVAFTPLLDARITIVLNNLRLRGYPLVVVDVLRQLPEVPALRQDPLVARLWRLERRAMHRDLRTLGITVLSWQENATLDETFAALGRRPLEARRSPR